MSLSSVRAILSGASYGMLRLTGRHEKGLRILMYHRVTDAHPKERLCVSPQAFEAQMRWLREAGYQTMTLAQAVRWVVGMDASQRPQRSVVLTFDDGFEDNFVHAAPVLAASGFTGCFFVPTAFAESDRERQTSEDRPMTWAQMQQLLRQGHEIGAHSVTHRKLARLAVEDVQREVVESKQALEHRLERPVKLFCYPAGSYTQAVKAAVRRAGFRGACTVAPGANRPGDDPLTLRRTEVSRFDSLWDFEKKMAGAYDWMHAAMQAVQRIRPARECTNAVEGRKLEVRS